nr:MAG TPA: hypothetical protein [Caudoviricetes sp.]
MKLSKGATGSRMESSLKPLGVEERPSALWKYANTKKLKV